MDALSQAKYAPRTYKGGSQQFGRPPEAYGCKVTSKYDVTCDYADDVGTSGATCSACCLVEKEAAKKAAGGNSAAQ
ncbi:MAG: hypothetical protein EOP06_25980 [Proteobacteria bacterium]|nr:MAG: hypothetical protein EOP06_25980 [Pseudomonadota bacterium]